MPLVFAGLIVLGVALAAGCVMLLRVAGARAGMARRLAGAREVKVGRLLDGHLPAPRAVRVVGRIRCRDPLEPGGGERLVAFHRDVEVRLPGVGWRSVERLRETRSFDLWDHDGSLTVDPARAAEPLVTLPKVWRGEASELTDPHASAVARLAERHGAPVEARAVTRVINVTDRLLVLAVPSRAPDGRPALEPPPGGYLISNVELPDAMRLLGGPHRRLVVTAVVGLGVAAALIAIGLVGAGVAALLGM